MFLMTQNIKMWPVTAVAVSYATLSLVTKEVAKVVTKEVAKL